MIKQFIFFPILINQLLFNLNLITAIRELILKTYKLLIKNLKKNVFMFTEMEDNSFKLNDEKYTALKSFQGSRKQEYNNISIYETDSSVLIAIEEFSCIDIYEYTSHLVFLKKLKTYYFIKQIMFLNQDTLLYTLKNDRLFSYSFKTNKTQSYQLQKSQAQLQKMMKTQNKDEIVILYSNATLVYFDLNAQNFNTKFLNLIDLKINQCLDINFMQKIDFQHLKNDALPMLNLTSMVISKPSNPSQIIKFQVNKIFYCDYQYNQFLKMNTFYFSCYDNHFCLYGIEKQIKEILVLKNYFGSFTQVFSGCGQFIGLSAQNDKFYVFDLLSHDFQRQNHYFSFQGHNSFVQSLYIQSNSSFLTIYAGSLDSKFSRTVLNRTQFQNENMDQDKKSKVILLDKKKSLQIQVTNEFNQPINCIHRVKKLLIITFYESLTCIWSQNIQTILDSSFDLSENSNSSPDHEVYSVLKQNKTIFDRKIKPMF